MTNEFSIGFETLSKEIAIDQLPIRGTIPDWLEGTLVRNGPAEFQIGKRPFNTWLDGMAMLHKFAFKDGVVSYANKYIESNTYKKNHKHNTIEVGEFATDPCRTLFQRVYAFFNPQFTDNTSVNIGNIADKYIAMTETSIPIEFDIDTLKTLGHLDYSGEVSGKITTAHPHYDFDRGETYNYTTHMVGIRSHYKIFRIPDGSSERILLSSLPVWEPSYMHSFAMTENYIILAEFPLVVYSLVLLGGITLLDKPFITNYSWKPESGTRFQVVRKSDGKLMATRKCEAFFAFHHINAFEVTEDDGEVKIVLDLAAFDSSSVINELYLDELRQADPNPITPGQFRRYTLSLEHETVEKRVITHQNIELPRINYRHYNARPYNYAYGISVTEGEGWFNQLAKIEIADEKDFVWSEPHCYPGEPVFIPRPDATAEDDGLILSVVLNAQDKTSFLLILDAQTFKEVGRATVPLSIPFGFHGQYLPLIKPEDTSTSA